MKGAQKERALPSTHIPAPPPPHTGPADASFTLNAELTYADTETNARVRRVY